MTAKELKHRLLRLIRQDYPGTEPAYLGDDVTQAVNWAYQVLWSQVPEEKRSHYTRRIDTISLAAGSREYSLAADVQDVIGPLYRVTDESPLMPLRHKSDLFGYGARVKGEASLSNGPVEAFYVERLHQTEDNATRIKLWVAPTPTAAVNVRVEVEIQAPRFTREDFCSVSPPKLQMPHAYVESLLLPVAGRYMMLSSHFNNPALGEQLEKEAQRALAAVGVTDPQVALAEPSK